MTYVERAPKTEAHEEEDQGRRSFLTKIIGAGSLLWLAGLAYPVLAYLNAPKRRQKLLKELDLGPLAKYKPGSVNKFGFGSIPAFLIRDDKGNLSALSGVCTHLGCTVQKKGAGFYCACHGGKYDITGKNTGGPPPKPLRKFRVEVKNDKVWVFWS